MHNSVGFFSIFTRLWNPYHYVIPHILIILKRNTVPICGLSPPSTQSPETTNLLSVSKDLSALDISYKWNSTICSFLCLASFTYNNTVFKIAYTVVCNSASCMAGLTIKFCTVSNELDPQKSPG